MNDSKNDTITISAVIYAFLSFDQSYGFLSVKQNILKVF